MRRPPPPVASRNGDDAAQRAAGPGAPASDAAADSEAAGLNDPQQTPDTDPWHLLLRQLGELVEYGSYYLSAKADGAKLGVRNALVSLTLAALAFVVVASLSVAAIWLVLSGAAEGLSVLCGHRSWAGNLLTGSLLVAGLGGGMWCMVIRLKETARERTVAKYESRNSRQYARYGHNVADRAAAAGPTANGPDANDREQP